MYIESVEIKNILSIGHISLDFGSSGLVLLDGWNHDDDSANGAGKSSIPNSIVFCLYDKFPRKIGKSEIIRRGSKSGFVKVVLSDGDTKYTIVRHRPKKLDFYIDDKKTDISQDEIENLIGLSYDQFITCVYSPQSNEGRFISLNDSDKKEFLLKIMKLDNFNEKKKILDLELKNLLSEKQKIDNLLIECKAKKEAYSDQLIDVEDAESKINALSVEDLQKKIEQIRKIKKPDISPLIEQVSEIDSKIKSIEELKIKDKYERDLFKKECKELEILKNTDISESSFSCPHCESSLFNDDNGVLLLEDKRKKLNEHVKDKEKKIKKILANINSNSDLSLVKNNLIKDRDNLNNQISHITHEFNKNKQHAETINNTINMRLTKIDHLKEKILLNNSIKDKIHSVDDILSKLNAKRTAIQSKIDIMSALSHIVSSTGAPAYILDSVIDTFNKNVSNYVSMVWPNASFFLQSFKENKNGEIKAKFSDKLVIQGREVSIGSLSGGEFRCLSLSIDFAIIDMIETVFNLSISPVFLDEPFTGLDSANRERVIDVLGTLCENRQIWIVDHASESKSMFSKHVKIEKKGGISDII